MITVSLAAGWQSAQGRRDTNQDAVLAERLPDGRELIAVADGMGGHRGGEEASRRALDALSAAVRDGAPLAEAIGAANAAVYAAARNHPQWAGMGTTLVALLRSGGRYVIANVGDSRAYRITSTEVRQITRDHSFAAEAASDGRMSVEELRRSPWRNALTRSIGTAEEVQADVFGPFDAVEAHVVVLCSDGLHGSLTDDAFRRCLHDASDPQDAARRLAAEAHGAGSSDNISAAVVVFGGRSLGSVFGNGRPRLHVSEPAQPAPVAAIQRPPFIAADRPLLLVPQRRRWSRRRRLRSAVLGAIAFALLAAAAVILTRIA